MRILSHHSLQQQQQQQSVAPSSPRRMPVCGLLFLSGEVWRLALILGAGKHLLLLSPLVSTVSLLLLRLELRSDTLKPRILRKLCFMSEELSISAPV